MTTKSIAFCMLVLLSTSCVKEYKPTLPGPEEVASIEQEEGVAITAPEGWKYFSGDEFNADTLNRSKWSVYGDPSNSTYGQPQGMIQTYRRDQVQMATASTGEKVVRITSVKRTDGDSLHGQPSWWSGAISSREVNVHYPLYCRMDVRAKVANVLGVWHSIWSRHYNGASTGEIDLLEFFVRDRGLGVGQQAVHLWNSTTGKTDYNMPPGQQKDRVIDNPATTFHTYSMQVEKDPNNANQAIITLLIDNVVNYSFTTNVIPNHNKFITDAISENRQNNTWDMVITGQVGGTLNDKGEGVGYPEESLTTAVTEIDYFRVYVRP